MSVKPPTEDFFISTIHQKVMAFLAKFSDREFHEREVARRVGISFGSANKALNGLFRAGILIQRRAGNMVFYKFDGQDPFLRTLNVYTTLALLRPLIEKLKADAIRIILFGSSAKGEDDSHSDIDLYVVADAPDNVRRIIDEFRLPRAYQDIPLKAVIQSTTDLLRSETTEPEFLSLINEGIVLWEWKSHEAGIQGMPEEEEDRTVPGRAKARPKRS
jgi:predicted nucleotidyltransferase